MVFLIFNCDLLRIRHGGDDDGMVGLVATEQKERWEQTVELEEQVGAVGLVVPEYNNMTVVSQ